jgi:hypothetical protein
VYDERATGTPRGDVVATATSRGGLRPGSSFPQSEPDRAPPHRLIVVVDAPSMLRAYRVAYARPGDTPDLGVIGLVGRDPRVTSIAPAGGTATDLEGPRGDRHPARRAGDDSAHSDHTVRAGVLAAPKPRRAPPEGGIPGHDAAAEATESRISDKLVMGRERRPLGPPLATFSRQSVGIARSVCRLPSVAPPSSPKTPPPGGRRSGIIPSRSDVHEPQIVPHLAPRG